MNKFILVAFLMTACAGATTTPVSPDPSLYKDAQTENRYKSVMRIITNCSDGAQFMGTGTAISPTDVITAHHVVDCADGGDGDVASVSLLLWDGSKVGATITKIGKKDAARLTSAQPLKNWVPVSWKTPKIGDTLCYTGGGGQTKFILTKCGQVIKYDEENDFWVYMHVVPGNSGGPVFNSDWQMVGIIDWRFINPGHPTENWENVGGGVLAVYFP